MQYSVIALWCALLFPLCAGFACTALPGARIALRVMCGCIYATAIAGFIAIQAVYASAPVRIASGWLFLDPLSAFHYGVLLLVFCLSSVYALVYFGHELRTGRMDRRQGRLFSGLWCFACAAMTLVLLSNNLGIMWVGIEATTLVTAFLICIQVSPQSVEATWKYIIICSVGMAFAFMGTLLIGASAKGLQLGSHDVLLWTVLRDNASGLEPRLIQAAFIFCLSGTAPRPGLRPCTAGSRTPTRQAPTPVSAAPVGHSAQHCAMYCIMRYLPHLREAMQPERDRLPSAMLLIGFGVLSHTHRRGVHRLRRET